MSKTILNQTLRSPIDGTESLVLATSGANWKAQLGTQNWIFQGVFGGNAAGSTLTLGSTTGAGTTDKIVFQSGSQVEALRIDTSQIIITGGVASSSFNVNGVTANVQFNSTGGNAGIQFAQFSNNTTGATNYYAKSRNATIGSSTIVQSGDTVAYLSFNADTGTTQAWGNAFAEAGAIACVVDGTPSSTSMPGKLIFGTTKANALSNTTQVSIDHTGLVTLAAGQINFPAVQNASSNANTLDDYSEGTWTPSVGGTATYTAQTGIYVKVGQIVYVEFNLIINAIGTGSTGIISGLPFTVSSAGSDCPLAVGVFASANVNVNWIGIEAQAGTTQMTVFGTTAAAAGVTYPLVFFKASTQIRVSGCYRTSA